MEFYNSCDNDHEEIGFNRKTCPFCEEVERMEGRIEELEQEIADLEES